MTKKQKQAFWGMFIGFALVATHALYDQGVFQNISILGGAWILVISYFVVAWFIHRYVKGNPSKFDD